MYKFNFLFSFILVISFGCDDPISCPNGKVNIDGACVCPKNQFELNGLCKPIEDDMYFIVENQCDCFESEIVLLKFTESDSSSTSIGRILLKDESNYPLSNYYTENDMEFKQYAENKYLFASTPIDVICNGKKLRYHWALEVKNEDELEVYVKYYNGQNSPLSKDPCKLLFRKK